MPGSTVVIDIAAFLQALLPALQEIGIAPRSGARLLRNKL
jgi:hypothetical protein